MKWTCTECGATGQATDRKAASRALDRHWYTTHREEGE